MTLLTIDGRVELTRLRTVVATEVGLEGAAGAGEEAAAELAASGDVAREVLGTAAAASVSDPGATSVDREGPATGEPASAPDVLGPATWNREG